VAILKAVLGYTAGIKMSKKTLYKMLAFMLVSFSLLAVVIYTELNPGLLDSQSDASVDALSNSVSTDEIITDSTNDDTSDQLSQQGNRKEPDSSEDGLLESQDANNDNINNEPSNREENSSEDDSDNQDNAVMVFTGDIYMSDSVLNQYNQNGINGILSPELQKEIKNADIAMANQEFPFSDRGTQMKDKQYTFRINPKYVKAFEDMQLDIVTLVCQGNIQR
jgi:poly-gamma-glutamate synthesis protein (capsule biosynthesis protein)